MPVTTIVIRNGVPYLVKGTKELELMPISDYADAHGLSRQAVHQSIKSGFRDGIKIGHASFIVVEGDEK